MQKTLWAVFLVGLVVVLYQVGEILGNHSTWAELQTPAGVGEILTALAAGLAAIAGALGIDFKRFLRVLTNGGQSP